jgi:hypothetical protein
MEFQIFLGENQISESGKVSSADARSIALDRAIENAKNIRLVADSSDDGKGKDHANWAELAMER